MFALRDWNSPRIYSVAASSTERVALAKQAE
jgi:hypothetical protein